MASVGIDARDETHNARDTGTGSLLVVIIHAAIGTEKYKKAIANTAEIPILCFVAICKRQVEVRGSARIEKSEMMLMMPPETKIALNLRHLPGIDGFQIFSLGVHWNNAENPMIR